MATDRIPVAGENGNGNGIVVMDVIRVRKEQRSKDGRDDCAAVLVSGQGSTLLERSTVLRVSAVCKYSTYSRSTYIPIADTRAVEFGWKVEGYHQVSPRCKGGRSALWSRDERSDSPINAARQCFGTAGA
ncbi:hypothetical protein V496_08874 [Pseudogymnoascus sp. VKM F-4515 (FW-2607)]|nr:hypothetical protein V496_08874 [Pseudogymnoascus sp. VKM F-4515 (FW-2607)]